MFDANVSYYTFDGDNNKELKTIQEYLFIIDKLERHVVNGCKAILICSCKNIDIPETKKILDIAKSSQYYDHRCFHQLNSIISAIYRYELGSNQLRLNLYPLSKYQLAHYKEQKNQMDFPIFNLYFKKDPIQWYHFREFKAFYFDLASHLMKFSSFVNAIVYNTIYRPNNLTESHYIDEKRIVSSVQEILGISHAEGNLDFSNLDRNAYHNWSLRSHPNPNSLDPYNNYQYGE